MIQNGTKPVGLKQIAEMAGVSISTVSMALSNHPHVNEETKKRIRELSRQVGYRRRVKSAQRSQQRGASRAAQRLGLVLLGSRIEDEVHMSTLHALTVSAAQNGSRLEVLALEQPVDAHDVLQRTLAYARRLDGLILSGMVEKHLLQELEMAGIPHVLLGHPLGDVGSSPVHLGQMVSADEVSMARLATQLLLNRGHRRVGFVCERLLQGLWNARWLRGYRIALLEEGADTDPALVHVAGQAFAGGEPAAAAFAQMENPPTAFIVPDVRVGASFLAAMNVRGRDVGPENLVLSGLSHLLDRYGVAQFPWVGYDLEQIAAIAVRQLRMLTVEPMPCLTQVMVPFAVRNVPPQTSIQP